MTRIFLAAAALAATAALTVPTAQAAECDPGKSVDDMSFEDALKVYECLKDDLQAGYQKGGKAWIPAAHVNDYPSWTAASTMPANPGFHGGRFLMTYVNAVGAEEYMKYAENPSIPAGTVLAKESFSVTESGKVRKGPLFLMEKVAAGTSPKTDDWFYYMVSAKGKPQAVNVFAACSECHQGNFGDTGGMGYPVEEARVK